MAKRTSSRLAHNRNLNNEIEAEIEKNEDDEAKNPVDPPAGSRKRKKGSTRDEPAPETQIDEPAQSLPAASKDRLLHLLDKHIKKKKPRRSSAGLPKSTVQSIPIPIISIQTEVQDQLDVQENQVDYSNFEVEDLVKMVSEVGVDTRGMDKLDLIRNCERFRDLIITPQHPRIDHAKKDLPKLVASKGQGDQGPEKSATEQPQSDTIDTSTSAFASPAHEKSSNIQSSRTIPSSNAESSRKKKKQAGPEKSATEQPQSDTIDTSTSAFASPAHEKSSNIQSSRTIPSSNAESSGQKKKGKERAQEETEDDYEEEQASKSIHDTDHDSDNSVEFFHSHKSKKRDGTKKKDKSTEEEEDVVFLYYKRQNSANDDKLIMFIT
ncbi:uncharacterized protein MELLADRAFT_63994 [Melampsora larici-populina 98AG31]|uniref:Uncharacterized protein n=1 Tax=Melampsora larici-populina (strain 98AG31 / pathotype 3-4-7) TaxID=747676 RepID=F4RPR9_MELLP|nr:uncharacterized protein MELLADRAFT_63994 [Melampsora larici-populina 98AG31]EGG05594.1 hypothetical protein MELLADRAFT_63994 [Melampsora larici-populina 98AG31]